MKIQPSILGIIIPVLLSLGCGGSGSSGGTKTVEPPIAITMNPSTISSSYLQGGFIGASTVYATLSRIPSGNIAVQLISNQDVFDPVTIVSNGTSTYFVQIQPKCMLEPGHYYGDLTVKLFHDSLNGESIPLTGNTLPYQLDVAPGAILQVKLNNTLQSGYRSWCGGTNSNLTVSSQGTLVEITSAIPVSWKNIGAYSAGFPTVINLLTTPTTWTGTILDSPLHEVKPGTGYGAIFIEATPISPANQQTVHISISVKD